MHVSKAQQRQASEFRGELADQLRSLAMDLDRQGAVLDTEPLTSAAAQCQRPHPEDSLGWQYRLYKLRFQTSIPRNTQPELDGNLNLELSVNVSGICYQQDHDPFTSLAVDIEAGVLVGNGHKHMSAWHLDRHIDQASAIPSFRIGIHPAEFGRL